MQKEFQKRLLSSIIIIPFSLFFIIKGSAFFICFLLALFFVSLLEWLKIVKKLELKLLGLFFLICSFYSTFELRDKDLNSFLLILIICVSTDLGGYFFGKFFKGPKLIKISPNKTYSGMFGSFLLAILISYLFLKNYDVDLDIIFNNKSNLEFVVTVIIISSISQIGDLIISYFKRSSNIKNTGNIFPGHGGLLDRIDGMIFVFPFVYLVTLVSIIIKL